MYKLSGNSGYVIRIADGATVPLVDGNADHAAYVAWVQAGNAAADADAPPPPSVMEQIRAIERDLADDQARLNRQVALAVALREACDLPAAAGKSKEEVHAILMVTKPAYKRLWEAEQDVIELRKQL